MNNSKRSSRFQVFNKYNVLAKPKRSQAWGMDLSVALFIFSIGIFVFFLYTLNQPGQAEENLENLNYDGDIIFQSILSNGYPFDWNNENVVTIGILSDNKINQTKLEGFYDLTVGNYTRTKQLFNTPYDYFFFLSDDILINENIIFGIGKPGTNPELIDAEDLIKITRFTIYNNKPVTAYLYIWR